MMSLFLSTRFDISRAASPILSFSEVVGSEFVPIGHEVTSSITLVLKRVFNRSFADSTCALTVDQYQV
jgi:hypothetical protein